MGRGPESVSSRAPRWEYRDAQTSIYSLRRPAAAPRVGCESAAAAGGCRRARAAPAPPRRRAAGTYSTARRVKRRSSQRHIGAAAAGAVARAAATGQPLPPPTGEGAPAACRARPTLRRGCSVPPAPPAPPRARPIGRRALTASPPTEQTRPDLRACQVRVVAARTLEPPSPAQSSPLGPPPPVASWPRASPLCWDPWLLAAAVWRAAATLPPPPPRQSRSRSGPARRYPTCTRALGARVARQRSKAGRTG